jgi:HD-GYP domain-containing protein (c-di-GMP phosphodiesterase class II)
MMDQAVEMYRKTLEMDPYFKDACLTLGTLYKKLGKLEQAAECMKKTLELDPNEADALYQIGLIHLQQENYEEAINSFNKAVMIMPENSTAHYSLGLSYFNVNKIQEAIHEYEIAVSLNPRDVQMRNALGISYVLNEDYEKGKECFNAILELNARDPIAHYNLANISFRELDFGNAVKYYEKVTEFDTSSDYSDFMKAVNYLRDGEDEKAVRVLADTVKKTPGSEKEMAVQSYIQIFAVAAIEQANRKMAYQAPFGMMESSVTEIVGILADITDARIPGNEGHSRRVSEIASIVAPDMGLSAEETSYLQFAGLIHDVGKLFIPESILEKEPEELTEEEIEAIQSHPELGYEILENVAILEESSANALFHHERYDGSGYPEGISGDEIPLGAQILGIADYWDNLINRRKLTPASAIDKIAEQRNLMFSSKILDTFLSHVDDFLLLY